jgi:hypothetical protein
MNLLLMLQMTIVLVNVKVIQIAISKKRKGAAKTNKGYKYQVKKGHCRAKDMKHCKKRSNKASKKTSKSSKSYKYKTTKSGKTDFPTRTDFPTKRAKTDSPTITGSPTETRFPTYSPTECLDNNVDCNYWASIGNCENEYSDWMSWHCRKACGVCFSYAPTKTDSPTKTMRPTPPPTYCMDNDIRCEMWASRGYCETTSEHSSWMFGKCRKTCQLCTYAPTITYAPTAKELPLVFKGYNAAYLSRCEGKCGSDNGAQAICDEGLYCFWRTGLEPVPSCASGGPGDIADMDYCVPSPTNSPTQSGSPTSTPYPTTKKQGTTKKDSQ